MPEFDMTTRKPRLQPCREGWDWGSFWAVTLLAIGPAMFWGALGLAASDLLDKSFFDFVVPMGLLASGFVALFLVCGGSSLKIGPRLACIAWNISPVASLALLLFLLSNGSW